MESLVAEEFARRQAELERRLEDPSGAGGDGQENGEDEGESEDDDPPPGGRGARP